MNRKEKRAFVTQAMGSESGVAQTLAQMFIDELDRIDKAAERLTFALAIYPGYRIDSRGPAGCLMDALDEIAPDVSAHIRESDAHEAYQMSYANDEDR